MERRVNFGYVGCGFMAQKVHIPNFRSIPRCNFLAIAEVRTGLGRRVQEKYKIPRLYSSHIELAEDDEIDAVGISGPFHVQGYIARDMLKAGKHVFVEKPMAVTTEQGEEILKASMKTGAKIMVGYMKRYDAGYELAKEYVMEYRRSGELGRIMYCRNHGFCGDWLAGQYGAVETTEEPLPEMPPPPTPGWLPQGNYNKYVNYLQQYVHNVNLLRWFLDAGDRVKVKAVDLDEDWYTGVVVMEVDGTRAVLETGAMKYHAWDEFMQVYFQRGWIKASSPPLMLRNATAQVEIYKGLDEGHSFFRPLPKDMWSWSYLREAEHFIDAVAEGRDFRTPGEDALIDTKVIEEIFKLNLRGSS
jgi:predicted dehydrogenase